MLRRIRGCQLYRQVGNLMASSWTCENFQHSIHTHAPTLQKYVSEKRTIPSLESEKEIIPKKHHVWVSNSQNIFTNLALENWIFENLDFTDQSMLLLWRNKPCVVIGRHQNPWQECDVAAARHAGVDVARRYSGGGAVYHDLGNMCLTFFTSRHRYDRTSNLEFIVRTLKDIWNFDISVADRDDILMDHKYKISGTAAKLVRKKAYHHCTLLLDANLDNVDRFLHTRMDGLNSKATESVRSKVCNLSDYDPTVHFNYLVQALSREYRKLSRENVHLVVDAASGISDKNIQVFKSDLESWKWVYGKTPDFYIQQRYKDSIDISFKIQAGHITEINLTDLRNETRPRDLNLVKEFLLGCKLHHEELNLAFNELLSHASDDSLPLMMTLCQAFDNIVENA